MQKLDAEKRPENSTDQSDEPNLNGKTLPSDVDNVRQKEEIRDKTLRHLSLAMQNVNRRFGVRAEVFADMQENALPHFNIMATTETFHQKQQIIEAAKRIKGYGIDFHVNFDVNVSQK